MPSIWPHTPGPHARGSGGTLTRCPHPRLCCGWAVWGEGGLGGLHGCMGSSVPGAPTVLPKVGRDPRTPRSPTLWDHRADRTPQ